jgi:hypothetical protein
MEDYKIKENVLQCAKNWFLLTNDIKDNELKNFVKSLYDMMYSELSTCIPYNKFFQKHIYNKYFEKYVSKNAKYCMIHTVNHITVEPLMEGFQAGFIFFRKSLEWNKYYGKFKKIIESKKSYNDYYNNRKVYLSTLMQNRGFNSSVSDAFFEAIVNIAFTYALYESYFSMIINIIINHKRFKNLSPVVSDCEFFYTHNLRNIFTKQDLLSERYHNIVLNNVEFRSKYEAIQAMPDGEEKDKANNYLLEYQHRYISSDFKTLFELSKDEKISKLYSEFVHFTKIDYETVKKYSNIVENLFDEECDRSTKQLSNVFSYSIIDSISDWKISKMNMIFNKHYIASSEIDSIIKGVKVNEKN